MPPSKWASRAFDLNTPPSWAPEVLERLEGTTPRIRHLIDGIPQSILIARPRETWSMQEHVGHLGDLQTLLTTRISEFISGADELSPADMTNEATWSANHNERAIEDVIQDFHRQRREALITLRALGEDDFARAVHHPRLKIPMRLIDLCEFESTHDDYHLARMRETCAMVM
ncbi:MAG: DinB family protein [Phycisphaerales bacterium JB043]